MRVKMKVKDAGLLEDWKKWEAMEEEDDDYFGPGISTSPFPHYITFTGKGTGFKERKWELIEQQDP